MCVSCLPTKVPLDELTKSLIEDILFDFDVEQTDDTIRIDYPGRGMFGKTCFALVLESQTDLLQVALGLSKVLGVEKASELVSTSQQASLGRSIVWYFPGFNLAEPQ